MSRVGLGRGPDRMIRIAITAALMAAAPASAQTLTCSTTFQAIASAKGRMGIARSRRNRRA